MPTTLYPNIDSCVIGHYRTPTNTRTMGVWFETLQVSKNAQSDITWVVLNNKPVSSAIVACSYLFVATFATTWGAVSWTYPSEIFPSKVRGKAVSLSTASSWFFWREGRQALKPRESKSYDTKTCSIEEITSNTDSHYNKRAQGGNGGESSKVKDLD
ncbi:hypothetical protein V8F33_012631 [Rhypophila sp. PSN 637]